MCSKRLVIDSKLFCSVILPDSFKMLNILIIFLLVQFAFNIELHLDGPILIINCPLHQSISTCLCEMYSDLLSVTLLVSAKVIAT